MIYQKVYLHYCYINGKKRKVKKKVKLFSIDMTIIFEIIILAQLNTNIAITYCKISLLSRGTHSKQSNSSYLVYNIQTLQNCWNV